MLLAWACACEAPESLPPAELAEVCGQLGPVQVLPLDERSVVLADEHTTLKVGDRYLYVVRRVGEGKSLFPLQNWALEGVGATTQVVSIDRCGGGRTVVAEDLASILAPRGDAGPFVGVHFHSDQLHWFDPHGRWPSQPIAIPVDWAALDARSVVVWRQSQRDVVIATLVDGGPDSEIEVLVEDVRQVVFATPDAPNVASGTAVALREDGVVVWLDLHERTVTPLRRGVAGIDVAPDGSWFVYTVPAPAERYEYSVHALWLYQREASALLTADVGVSEWGFDFLVTGDEVDDDAPRRVTLLPSRAGVTLPEDWSLLERLPHGGLIMRRWPTNETLAITLASDGLTLVSLPGDPLSYTDELAFYRDAQPYLHFPEDERPFDLLATSLRTGATEVVQPRMWSGVALPRDRWIRLRDLSAEDTGTLVVIDGATGSASRVDDEVYAQVIFDPHTRPDARPWRTDELVYHVRDPDSSRHGLWRVAFPR